MPGEPLLAFDALVYGTSAVYSSSFLDSALAELESYSIQANVHSSSENTLTVQLETSADGRNWVQKNPGVPEVTGSFAPSSFETLFGGDVGARPALALVRLRVQLANAGSAHVRIYVRQGPDTAFSPLVLRARMWLRADLGVTLDGNGAVSSWRDMTLNGFDATQGTSTRRPAVASSSQQVGGRPALFFSASAAGSEKIMNLPSLASLTAGHVFTVFRRSFQPPPSTLRSGFVRFGTSGQMTHVPYTDGVIYDDTGSTTRRNLGAAGTLTASAQCLEVRSASAAWSAYLNGGSLGSSGSNTVGFSATPEIGGDFNVGGFYDGSIAEIVLFDRILATNERGRLVQYLKARYLIASFP